MLLADTDIDARLAGGPWKRDGAAITRELQCENFMAVVELVGEVARVAEDAGHHPDILIHSWNRLRLTLSTHSEGGVTEADLSLAGRLDALLP